MSRTPNGFLIFREQLTAASRAMLSDELMAIFGDEAPFVLDGGATFTPMPTELTATQTLTLPYWALAVGGFLGLVVGLLLGGVA